MSWDTAKPVIAVVNFILTKPHRVIDYFSLWWIWVMKTWTPCRRVGWSDGGRGFGKSGGLFIYSISNRYLMTGNLSALGDVDVIVMEMYKLTLFIDMLSTFPLKLVSAECHRKPLMISRRSMLPYIGAERCRPMLAQLYAALWCH